MRVLIVSCTYAPQHNGQAVFVTHLAEGIACRGHEVWVLTHSETGEPYRTERSGVHIQTVRTVDMGFLHTNTTAAIFPDAEVRRFFKEFKPDIVHIQDHYPLCVSALNAARRANIRVIGTNHFVPENLAPYVPLLPHLKPVFNTIMWQWMKWTFDSMDVITAPSRIASEIIGSHVTRAPIYPVSCGVNLEQFYPDPSVDRQVVQRRFGLNPDLITFFFVGRVDAEKRLDVLIQAISLMDRKDIQLAISGRGAAMPGLQALAARLHIEDNVRFTGFVSDEDLHALFNSIEIFAMASEAELLSIASLEAMASGRPLLLANSKALPELVRNGINGYMFEPGNVSDAAYRMAMLADHPEEWAEMGAASLRRVQMHSLENVLDCYEELYSQIICSPDDLSAIHGVYQQYARKGEMEEAEISRP